MKLFDKPRPDLAGTFSPLALRTEPRLTEATNLAAQRNPDLAPPYSFGVPYGPFECPECGSRARPIQRWARTGYINERGYHQLAETWRCSRISCRATYPMGESPGGGASEAAIDRLALYVAGASRAICDGECCEYARALRDAGPGVIDG